MTNPWMPKTKESEARKKAEEKQIKEWANDPNVKSAKAIVELKRKAGFWSGEDLVRRISRPILAKRAKVDKQMVKGIRPEQLVPEVKEETIPPEIQEIRDRYSEAEYKAIIKSLKDGRFRFQPGTIKIPVIDFTGDHWRFGVVSDPHCGSNFTLPEHQEAVVKEFKKEKVDMVVLPGDVCAGVDPVKSPSYELRALGASDQKNEAVEWLKQMPAPTYVIDGNHDRWFKKQNGLNIVEEICKEVKQANYLGHDEGDISLKGSATIKLWHGLDGSSYALSYRLQKILESLTGGEKPNILIAGHAHKALYLYERMVHVVSAGSLQRQTSWMRGKKLAAHVGFWIIDVWVNKSGVAKFSPTWYPFYC